MLTKTLVLLLSIIGLVMADLQRWDVLAVVWTGLLGIIAMEMVLIREKAS